MAFSQISVVGRLTKDPVVKEVTVSGQTQSVANFSVACDRDFGEGTDYYDVVVWRKLADNVGKYLSKGREVLVVGRMQKRTYTAKLPESGVEYPRDVWEINAEKVQFLGNAGSQDNHSTPQENNQRTTTAAYSGSAPF